MTDITVTTTTLTIQWRTITINTISGTTIKTNNTIPTTKTTIITIKINRITLKIPKPWPLQMNQEDTADKQQCLIKEMTWNNKQSKELWQICLLMTKYLKYPFLIKRLWLIQSSAMMVSWIYQLLQLKLLEVELISILSIMLKVVIVLGRSMYSEGTESSYNSKTFCLVDTLD